MKWVYSILAVLVVICVAWNVSLYLSFDKETLSNYLFNLGYTSFHVLGAGVAWWGIRRYHLSSTLGKSLACYGLAMVSYTIALGIWTFYNVVLQQPSPYPGVPDLFFVLFYPFAAAGLVFLTQSFGGKFTWRSVIETVILFGLLFAMLYSFLVQGSLGDDLPWLTRLLNMLYPALDALLAALAITAIRTEKGALHPNLLLIAFASLVMAAADTIFSYRSTNGTYWNGDVADTLYMVSAILFALAIAANVFKPKKTGLPNSAKLSPPAQ